MRGEARSPVLWGKLAWHPAVKAWTRFAQDGAEPETIEVLRDGNQSATYRLIGAGSRGEAIIARRARAAKAAIEQAWYRLIHRLVPVKARRYRGSLPGNRGFVWLFFEDAA
ncbi:MAG TPA: hypothetical protein VM716_02745 [Gemmatimonadales bacterium]|nr:hypothetical protein [Gemmatimonadales bacterium]